MIDELLLGVVAAQVVTNHSAEAIGTSRPNCKSF